MTTDNRSRTDGWPNICDRFMPGSREACGLRYWYLAHKGVRMTIGPDGEPTTQPHVCRTAESPAEPPTVARVALDGTVSDTYVTEAESNGYRASQAALFDRGRPARPTSPLQASLL